MALVRFYSFKMADIDILSFVQNGRLFLLENKISNSYKKVDFIKLWQTFGLGRLVFLYNSQLYQSPFNNICQSFYIPSFKTIATRPNNSNVKS